LYVSVTVLAAFIIRMAVQQQEFLCLANPVAVLNVLQTVFAVVTVAGCILYTLKLLAVQKRMLGVRSQQARCCHRCCSGHDEGSPA
jgi:hypothetical protein